MNARVFRNVGRVAVSFLAIALAACGADFDPGSRVTDFRVMAVQADAPYAAPARRCTSRRSITSRSDGR